MSQTRAETIASYVERRLLDGEESVTVWNEDAVVVFAGDASLIGTQDRRFRAQIEKALEDGTRSEVTNGSLHTLVPLTVGESDKPVVVAEVIQPNDAIASAGRPWIYAAVACGLLAFLALFAAIRVQGGSYASPAGNSARGADLRRAHKSLQIAERALEQSKAEETTGPRRARARDQRAPGVAAGAGGSERFGRRGRGEDRRGEERAARTEAELNSARNELAALSASADEHRSELEAGKAARSELEQLRVPRRSRRGRRREGTRRGRGGPDEARRGRRPPERGARAAERAESDAQQARERLEAAETARARGRARAERAEVAAKEIEQRATELASETGSPTQRSAELHRLRGQLAALEQERDAVASERDQGRPSGDGSGTRANGSAVSSRARARTSRSSNARWPSSAPATRSPPLGRHTPRRGCST
jgi:hypothetical protein